MFVLHLFTEVSANPTYSLDLCCLVVFFKLHLLFFFKKGSHKDNMIPILMFDMQPDSTFSYLILES